MGLFGKSFEEQVNVAIDQLRKQGLARTLAAQVEGKTVTLTGEVASADAKAAIMNAFNALVATDNTINMIPVAPAATPMAAAVAAAAIGATPGATAETIHEVVKGDTLSALAKRYLGSANRYMDIFNANKDQLNNPDMIKVGQKLRIPK
jgi:nucleoid-associated protein YgaU